MTRLLALASAVFLVACDVGSILNRQGGPDGGGKQDGAGKTDGSASANCEQINNTPPTAHQHTVANAGPGQACLNSNCHLAVSLGTGANPWAWGGTLYKGDGVTPIAGATILVTPSGGTPIKAITMTDGTFCAALGAANNGCVAGAALTSGSTTYASGCPAPNSNMATTLQAQGGGNCDNCHRTGGAAGLTIQLNLP